MKCTERRLSVAGLELAAKMWGDGRGKPVVALHGWLDNAASFDGLAPILGDEFTIAALDLVGHGRSQWREVSDAYHFIDWVAVVLEAADELGWERFSMLGHSMGAAIASLVGGVSPTRVDRMVLLDGLGPFSQPADEAVEQFREAVGEELVLRDSRRRRYDSIDEMLGVMENAREDVSRQKLRLLLKRGARRDEEGRWVFCHDRALQAASRIRLTEAQVRAFLRAIECPVLLIRPRWGWPVEEEMMQGRTKAVADLKVVHVEGGHHVHLEVPHRVEEPVREFLTESPNSDHRPRRDNSAPS